ncbi:MAG: PAS domain S-box protein, partial [Anaerolineales bacterium]
MNLLVLEDNPLDFRMVRQLIEQTGLGEIQILHCERLSEALRISDQSPPDVILADLNLPDSSGLDTIERLRNRFPQVALIVLSGLSDETLATLAVQAGAQDYLVKEQVNQELLRSAIRYALERKRIENELRRRVALERLVADISTHFISPTLEELDDQINHALQNIGGFFGVERVVLLLFSADGVRVERAYEWQEKGLPAWGNSMTGRSTENVSWLMTRLSHNEPVYVTNIGDLPVEADAERQMWHRAGVQSLVLVPVRSGNALIGNFGLVSSRAGLSVSENDTRFLRLIGEVFIHAVEARRAVEAQRASDYAYRTLLEHSLQELLIIQDGCVVFANPTVSINSGNSLTELLEMTPDEILAGQHPEDRPQIAELMKNLLIGKTSLQRIEYRRFNKDGSISWMDALYTLIQYRGRPAIQIAQLDITERKLAEARLKHRLEMESLVTSISTRFIDLAVEEVDHEIKQALRAMGEFADVDRCYVYVLGQDEPRIIHEYCWQTPGVSQKSLEMAGLWLTSLPWLYDRLQHKEFVHVFSLEDLPAEARAEKAFWGRQDVCSLLLVPLIRGGQLAGFLGMDMLRHERRWVEEDLTLLKLMSDVLSNALSAKWTEETLRKSESQYRLLADSIQDVIGLHKMDGTILFLSPSAEKVLGWKLAEHIGRNLFDEVAKDNDPLLVQEARDRLSKGQDAVFEWRCQANGSFVWVETLAHPILEKGKEPE